MLRNKDSRKVLAAVLVSLLLHVVIAFSLAAFGSVLAPVVPDAAAAPELTFVDLAPTPTPEPSRNPQFLETDEAKATTDKPKEQTFESNANSIAASEREPSGDAPLPSQEGKERPLQLETHDASLAMQGSQTQKPAEPPKPTPRPSATPQPTPPDELAMLTSTPPPAFTPEPTPENTPDPVTQTTPQPQQPSSVYRDFKEKTKITGGVTNRGPAAVNAVGTPIGRYQKAVIDAIGARWYYHIRQKADLVGVGTLRLQFVVDPNGKVQKLKVMENTSNEAFANVCLQSVLEAQFPPIPDDLKDALPPDGLEFSGFNFTMFAN